MFDPVTYGLAFVATAVFVISLWGLQVYLGWKWLERTAPTDV